MSKFLRLFLVTCLVCSSYFELFAQQELKHTLPELHRLLENSKTVKSRIDNSLRISNFYANNKIFSKNNVDSAVYFAKFALRESANYSSETEHERSVLALAKAKLKLSDVKFVLSQIATERKQAKVKLLIELGSYYLYKPKEEKTDLDSAYLLLNQAADLARTYSLPKIECLTQLYICDVYRERGENVRSQLSFLSLIEEAKKAKDLETAAAASSRWGDHLPFSDEKINYYQTAAQLYKSIGFLAQYVNMQKAIADVNLNMGRLQQAEAGLLSVLSQYQSLGYKNLQFTYDLLSIVNRLQGKFKESLSNSLLAIKYMELTGSDASKGYFFNNLGNTYAELGNTAESVKAYQQSLAAMQYQNAESRLTSLEMLADGLIKDGHIKEAISLSNLYDKQSKRAIAKTILARIKGKAYQSLKQNQRAEKYFLQMIFWESKMELNLFQSAECFYAIAQFYATQNDFSKSNYYYNKVLALPKGVTPLSSIRNIYFSLYKADSAQNNLKSALENYKRYKQINDSLVNARSNHDMQELLIQYQANQKEQDNELLRKESILQHNKLQRVEWLSKVTVIGCLALLAILALSFYGFRKRKKANQLLASHQHEIEIKNNSLQTLIEKQAKLLREKEWLIKEIHHRIKNNLQVITSLLNTQSSYLQNEVAIKAIRDSQNRIQSISLIHQKLFQSESVALINLHSYIVDLMKFLCDTFHVNQRIKFNIDVPEIELDISQAMPLGLIINEAITNIIKYAFPNRMVGEVDIIFSVLDSGNYQFVIEDNGVGLPNNGISNSDETVHKPGETSLGITLINGLSAQLGGEVNITSNNGVKISLEFPALADEG